MIRLQIALNAFTVVGGIVGAVAGAVNNRPSAVTFGIIGATIGACLLVLTVSRTRKD